MKKLSALPLMTGIAIAVTCLAWRPAQAAPATDSAYSTDVQDSHVEDRTSQAVGTVNMITCFMASMKPNLMVNLGDYAALVDENRCDPRAKGSSDTPDYTRAIVNSSRISNSDPMKAKVWVEDEQDGQAVDIFVSATASQAPSSTLPYGIFEMDFAAGGATPFVQGRLASGTSGLTFIEREGDGRQTRVFLNALDSTSGSGAANFMDDYDGVATERTIRFGYNPSHFLRSDGTNSACFSRSLAQAKISVWRYGLYDANTGARIDRNAGFPIKTTINGKTIHAYIGQFGLSAPESANALLTTGTTVSKESRDGTSAESYTLLRSGGKLTRHTRTAKTLASIDGLPFEMPGMHGLPGLPSTAFGRQITAKWDNASLSFKLLGVQQCGQNGCKTVNFDAPVTITPAQMNTAFRGGLHGYSQVMGGSVFIPQAALSGENTNVYVRTRAVVLPGDTAVAGATLYCTSDCPTPTGLTAMAQGSAETPFGASAMRFGETLSTDVVAYAVNGTTGELTHNGASVVWTGTADALRNSRFGGGIQSGRLVTSTAGMTCPSGMGSTSSICPYKAEDLAEYYTWETGANPWNQWAGLKTATNTLVEFEAPLRVEWAVPNDTTRFGEYAGKTLNLEYSGFGNLNNIPGHCVDRNTNREVACDRNGSRWVPAIAIPFDSSEGLVRVAGTNTSHLVKWLDREVRFAQVPTSQCSALSVGDAALLPNVSGLKNPSNPSAAEYIGAKPTITAAPKVIHGVVQ